MRKIKLIGLVLFLFITVSTTAQTEIYISGGINNTSVSVNKTRNKQDKYYSDRGWTGGLQAEHLSKNHLILSGGISISSNPYTYKFLSGADVIITYDYEPVYLRVPINIGYSLPLTKNISTRFYGGFSFSKGISGNVDVLTEGSYPNYSESLIKRKIRFGNDENFSNASDFTRHYWGAQTGLSITLYKKMQLEAFYNHGLTNVLPKYVSDYENQKLNFFSIAVKYNLLCKCVNK